MSAVRARHGPPRRGHRAGGTAAACATVILAACGGSQPAPTPGAVESGAGTIAVKSPAFADGATLPVRFTCDGDGVSPPLTWSGVPAGAAELVLTVRDPDAPGAVYTHWTVYAIAAGSAGVELGRPPPGSLQGRSSRGDAAYAPPCPPRGATHHYVFRLVALRSPSGLAAGATPGEVLSAVAGKVVGAGELTAVYGR